MNIRVFVVGSVLMLGPSIGERAWSAPSAASSGTRIAGITGHLFFGEQLATLLGGNAMPALRRLEAHPEFTEPMLYSMYDTLVRIEGGVEPEEERVRALRRASDRYAAFLAAVADDGVLPSLDRSMAEHTLERLQDGSFLTEMGDVRGAVEERDALDLRSRALEGGARAGAAAAASSNASSKNTSAGAVRISLMDLKEHIRAARSELDRAAASGDQHRLRATLRRLGPRLVYWRKILTRFSDYALRRSFVDQRPHRAEDISTGGGIILRSEPDGFLLTARFATNIRDPAKLSLVVSSIESHWRGEWTLSGRAVHWRTHVEIDPQEAGRPYASDRLLLLDGGDEITHSRGPKLVLGRGFGPSAPAHEFGHLLGLEDEYSESYDPRSRTIVFVERPESIMGSPNGKVLPEHFARIYSLLRERGLVDPPERSER